MPSAATITVPIVLDASATAQIFSKESIETDTSYVFTMNSSVLGAADLSNFVLYTDDNSDNTLFAYSESNKTVVQNNLAQDICNQDLTFNSVESSAFPNDNTSLENDTIGEMLVKYIASALFGHPEAQAPIENDDSIVRQVQVDSSMSSQFVTELSDGLDDYDVSGDDTVAKENMVLQSIFEQLVSHSSSESDGSDNDVTDNRFNVNDTGKYHGIPFRTGDTIIFLVSMTGKLTEDTTDFNDIDNLDEFEVTGTDSNLVDLFGNNVELEKIDGKLHLKRKIWELRVTLV